ncbi:general transcription factor IIF subunit 2 isoform 3 [Mus musculus]|uniref:general transcription factor IIF subunit 2 isoform 3 n=1 Tax=Mus musculus TaxID=10090 RepID=UPI0023E0B9DF|nr:general transcription factor IIF subunit 2 isoform 3 [Mus musculus]
MAERGELDLTGAKQNTGVWLVKVPKYLSQQWAKASGRGEVGKLRIAKLQIEESSKPVRLSQQLDKVVTTNYKPVANHQYNIEYERKKKEDGKRARADKQHVLDMLFSAFEKHQYYNLKDLVDITKQPVGYLKEILKEIGIQNVKGIHKNTWELKPEYRHYQTEEKSD